MSSAPPRKWGSLDVSEYAANWVTDDDGTERRMAARAIPIRGLANGVDHLLARQPLLRAAVVNGDGNSGDIDPLWQFRWPDVWPNGREIGFHVLWYPRTAGSGDAEAYVEGASAETTGVVASGSDTVSGVTFPTDLNYTRIVHDRGAAAGGAANFGLTKANGMSVYGLSIQDLPIDLFDKDNHTFCPANAPSPGDPIIEGLTETVRANFHEARSLNRRIVGGWSAVDPTTTTQLSTNGANALYVSGSTSAYTNPYDNSFTHASLTNTALRAANSPGHTIPAKYAGVGYTAVGGTRTPRNSLVDCYVLAINDDGGGASGDAEVAFIGPTGISSNNTSITIPENTTTPTWFGGSSYQISLDSSVDDDDATTACNKIDIALMNGVNEVLEVRAFLLVKAYG